MPVSVNVHLVIRSNNKSVIEMLLSFTVCKSKIVRIGVAQVCNNIAYSVVNTSIMTNLLFDDRMIILL